MNQSKTPGFDPKWLEPGGMVPVDASTTAVLCAEVHRLRAENYSLHTRLEDNFSFDEHGNRIEHEPNWPDGITCRNETIKLQDAEIDRLRAELVRLEWVEKFSKDTVAENDSLRDENDSLKAEIDWHVEEIKRIKGGE